MQTPQGSEIARKVFVLQAKLKPGRELAYLAT